MQNESLVSALVCTYNSSRTVIETLESITSQTYKNIELVISDDDSKDVSVEICEKWVEKNKNRFVRTRIITHTPNTGTSANLNRAFSEAQGEWVKVIAADDKLLPNCISDYIDYVYDHPEASIVFSKVVGFGNMEAANKWPFKNVKRFFDAFSTKQFRIILSTSNFLPAASVFLKKKVWEDLEGYDESIPLLEDWPFWVNALKNGYCFDFLDKETVSYRFSELSVSQGQVGLSGRYLESNRRACIYACRSLSQLGFLYWYLYQTMRIVSCFKRKEMFLRALNIFNPAYYQFNDTINMFKVLI